MNQSPLPELADGGYWYRVPAVTVNGGTVPDGIGDTPFCGFDFGGEYVIRVLSPVAGLPALDSAQIDAHLTAIGFSVKPFARIGGI